MASADARLSRCRCAVVPARMPPEAPSGSPGGELPFGGVVAQQQVVPTTVTGSLPPPAAGARAAMLAGSWRELDPDLPALRLPVPADLPG